jgi:hypothetical protein
MRLRMLITAIAVLVAAASAIAGAAPISRQQAIRVTKRAASERAAAEGVTLSASSWTAACYHARHRRWRCDAGAMGGYCNARVYVGGTARRPIAASVRVSCFD